MSPIKRIDVNGRMSQAVIHNGVVYLAGQVGAPKGSVTEQTQAVLTRIDELLEQAGTDKSRILKAVIWLASMDDYDEMNLVWDEWVAPGNPPVRAAGETNQFSPEYKIEIIITAAQP